MSNESRSIRSRPAGYTWAGAAVAGLTVITLLQAYWFRAHKSATYDETFYVSCARHTLWQQSLDPRLASGGVAPVPVLLCHLPAAVGYSQFRADPHRGQLDDPVIVRRARALAALLFGVTGVWLVFGWLLRDAGLAAACLGGGLMACSPNLIAHSSLAATDMAFTTTTIWTLATVVAVANQSTVPRLMHCGIALGTALATKYSAIFLVPVLVLVLMGHVVFHNVGTRRRRMLDATVAGVLVLDLALLMCWGWHGFRMAALPPRVQQLEWVQTLGPNVTQQSFPTPLVGVLVQAANNTYGHSAYLMGHRSRTGWWPYYPLAWLVKSTPAEWASLVIVTIAALAALIGVARGRLRRQAADRREPVFRRNEWILLASAVTLVGLAMTSRINIGLRYILPVYPILFLLLAITMFRTLRQRVARVLASLLVLVQAVSIIAVAPHYLAYFSPVMGGPANGHRWLVDSNLDWGQDLPELRETLDRLDAQRAAICYFGTADPAAYGIHAAPLDDANLKRLEEFDWLVVSATFVQGVYTNGLFADRYTQDAGFYAALRDLDATARAGYSIHLYDLADPHVRRGLSNWLSDVDSPKNVRRP